MGADPLGWVQSQHVLPLLRALPGVGSVSGGLCWDVHKRSPAQRSQDLALAAVALREQGLIRGWRDECYSHWGAISHDPDPAVPEWFRLERSAFRFFGLRSHAVHINGFTPDGRMWCARRALSKATDPGRLDNLAAGGLAAGEGILSCAVRELYEEAGIVPSLAQQVQRGGQLEAAHPAHIGQRRLAGAHGLQGLGVFAGVGQQRLAGHAPLRQQRLSARALRSQVNTVRR